MFFVCGYCVGDFVISNWIIVIIVEYVDCEFCNFYYLFCYGVGIYCCVVCWCGFIYGWYVRVWVCILGGFGFILYFYDFMYWCGYIYWVGVVLWGCWNWGWIGVFVCCGFVIYVKWGGVCFLGWFFGFFVIFYYWFCCFGCVDVDGDDDGFVCYCVIFV